MFTTQTMTIFGVVIVTRETLGTRMRMMGESYASWVVRDEVAS
jgi:hypothetical protein